MNDHSVDKNLDRFGLKKAQIGLFSTTKCHGPKDLGSTSTGQFTCSGLEIIEEITPDVVMVKSLKILPKISVKAHECWVVFSDSI
jgi:hypothetical protein